MKALGDHTARLPETLRTGQVTTVEGPYGTFTFDDAGPQIWIGAGIGITPFLARMRHLATVPSKEPREIDLFHLTRDEDTGFLADLDDAARAAGVRLHVLIESRDGLMDGERMRAAAPLWTDATIWFCGPSGLARYLEGDLSAQGFPVGRRFRKELFELR